MLHPAIESNAEEVMTGVRWTYGLTREQTASQKSFPGADFAEKIIVLHKEAAFL